MTDDATNPSSSTAPPATPAGWCVSTSGEYHVPFVAAGRSEDRLKESMESHVAGIETANYEIATVDHDVAP